SGLGLEVQVEQVRDDEGLLVLLHLGPLLDRAREVALLPRLERLAVERAGGVEEGGLVAGLGHDGLLRHDARAPWTGGGVRDQAAWVASWAARMERACWAACLSISARSRRLFGSCMSTRTSGSLSVWTSSGLWPMAPSASASSGVTPRAARKALAASPSCWR